MEWLAELNKLDNYDLCFYASLCLAFISVVGSVVLSYFSAKYWKLDRSRAFLKNVGDKVDNIDLDQNRKVRNLCRNVGDIDLTNDCYRVEFGIPAQPIDAITLRAVIEGTDWIADDHVGVQATENKSTTFYQKLRKLLQKLLKLLKANSVSVQATVFLSDDRFVINSNDGKVSIYTCDNKNRNNMADGILYYDEQK